MSTNNNRSVDPMNLIGEYSDNTTTGKVVTPDNKSKIIWNIKIFFRSLLVLMIIRPIYCIHN